MGYYKSEEHLKWIMGANDKGSLVYNVRLQLKGEEPRTGAHTAGFYNKQNVQFVVLYTDGAEETGEYRVFHVKDTAQKVTEERMRETWYPMEEFSDDGELKPARNYYFFRFDEEVTIGNLKFKEMFAAMKSKHFVEFGSYTTGEPLFASAEWIIKERFK